MTGWRRARPDRMDRVWAAMRAANRDAESDQRILLAPHLATENEGASQ